MVSDMGEAIDEKSHFSNVDSGGNDSLRPTNDHHEQGDIDAE